jgi:hypothetical protein
VYLSLVAVPAVPALVRAQSYEKNNMPCVAELCVGDGLADRFHVKWEPAKDPIGTPVRSRSLAPYELARTSETFRGNVKLVAPYLSAGTFDNNTLPLLKA